MQGCRGAGVWGCGGDCFVHPFTHPPFHPFISFHPFTFVHPFITIPSPSGRGGVIFDGSKAVDSGQWTVVS